MKTGTSVGIGCRMVAGVVLAAGMLAGTAWGADFTSSSTGYWTNPVTWGDSPGDPTPTNSADNVYIQSGHTITIDGTSQISINSLSITGTLTHVANASTDANIINLKIGAGGLTIDGSIDVTAKGLTTVLNDGRSGGTHGGQGGWGMSQTYAANPYGSPTNPVTSGSAGTYGGTGQGGGVVVLNVTGSATISGDILAKGYSFTASNGGGGAGGSINITANSISGGGQLDARGGEGYNNAAGGGGGRIALITAGSDFGSLTMDARGGGDGGNTSYQAACGTIYLKKGGDTLGALLLDGKNLVASVARTILPSGTYQFDAITTTNIGLLVVGSGASLDLTGCALRSDSTTNSITSRLIVGTAGSTVTWPAAWTNHGTISWTGTNAMFVTSDLTLASGGILTHEATSPGNKINLNLTGNLTIDSGGAIWVSAKGNAGTGNPSGSRAAGGYGGEGGYYNAYGGTTYGSITNPVLGGSQGYSGYYGGGAVIVRVTGAITNNGAIVAKGTGTANSRGAGSGGAINLTAGSLAGGGSLQADGGDYVSGDTNQDCPGGGGRIAVVLTNSATFGSVTMSAAGGTTTGAGNRKGGAGTIYLCGTNSAFGKLIVPQSLGTRRTLISTLTMESVAGDVELRSGALLAVENPRTLTVYGNWSNASANAVGGDGAVELKGTTTNTFFGSTTFPSLICTNVARTLLFEAGTTNTVTGTAGLKFLGVDAANLLALESASPPSKWYFKVPSAAQGQLKYLAVSNSWAVTNGAAQITAVTSEDRGGNTNWIFSNPTDKYWISLSDTNWNTADNWSPSGAPTADDLSITISNGTAAATLMDASYTFNGRLTIQSGATLNLNGKTLTVNGAVTNQGAINAAGSETLTLSGDVDFTGGGSYTPATSTLKLAAAAAGSQTFKPDGETFHRIEVPNAATVTFSDAGFTASQFSCRAGGATLNFNAGSTYAITDLDLRGSSSGATTNFVTLRSTASPTRWNLNVSRAQAVRYVDAQDSEAGGGLTIYAVNSKDSTGNNNWNFGNGKAWAGGTSTDWANAANWSPASVPGATDFVLIDGYYANAPTLGANTNIGGLAVAGYASNAVLTLNGTLTVAGNAVVHPTYGKIKFTTDTAGGALTVGTNLTVFGTIECQRSSTAGNGAGRVITVGGDLMVASSGLIDAYAMGFTAGGPGMGYRAGAHGGEDYGASTPRGTTYGSITQPTSLGNQGWASNPGGGAIRLNVGGLTTIESGALINANATAAGQSGAGGSVWLTTGTLAGGGTITAKGGDTAGGTDGIGGGGRIAIVVTNGPYTGSLTLSAYGGINGNSWDGNNEGAAGTVYVKGNNTAADGQLIVDNAGYSLSSARTRIGSSVTEKTVGDVILRNAGYMAVSAGETLTAKGSWSNAVAAAAMSGGTVEFAGTSPATVWGANNWSNLTINTAGKVVSFEATKTQTITGTPTFDNNVTLQSTAASQWILTKGSNGSTQSVGVVTVADSDASGGMTFEAAVGSTDVTPTENLNWEFLQLPGTILMIR